MKGTMGAMLGAVRAVGLADLKLKGDLTILSTIEEETGSAGALSAVLRGYRAEAAIFPEPTGFAVCPVQGGGARFKISLKGKSAHAGQRYLGGSALEKADLVRRGLNDYEDYLNEHYKTPVYAGMEKPFCVNVGVFNSGDWFCTVPETAYLEGRLAVPPGLTVKESLENIRRFVQAAVQDDTWLSLNPPQVDIFGTYWESAAISLDHPIVKTTAAAFEGHFNRPARLAGTPWGTDGRMFTELAGTPALVFGPGVSAHCPDEFLGVKDLLDYTKILARILVDWCGVAEN